jgi:uncharacterized integral membrane protein (TIGR00697 family)
MPMHKNLMTAKDKIYLSFAVVFCVIQVFGNIVFQKILVLDLIFFSINISAGLLFFPIAFLIMDIITENYNKEYAYFLAFTSTWVNMVVVAFVFVVDNLPAAPWSIIDDASFHKIFSAYHIAVLVSIIAMFLAQIVSIMIFLFLKNITHGRHLWLRNNVSTIIAQFLDTLITVLCLAYMGFIPEWSIYSLIISAMIFKTCIALLDTPFCYIINFYIKKKLK